MLMMKLINLKLRPKHIVVGKALGYGARSDLLEGIGVNDVIDRAVAAGEGGIPTSDVVDEICAENGELAEICGVEVTGQNEVLAKIGLFGNLKELRLTKSLILVRKMSVEEIDLNAIYVNDSVAERSCFLVPGFKRDHLA